MDSQGNFSEQLSETIEHLKARLEFEAYFSKDYLPGNCAEVNPEVNNGLNYKVIAETNHKSLSNFGQNPVCLKENTSANSKEALIIPLYQKAQACVFCDLHKTRTNIVFGDGSLDAKIVFVGEAPGRDEDIQAKPFVGLAGGLLTKIINAMQMKRSDVYITNVLRCRPPHNRNPLPEEVVCCKPYLIELLKIIKPKVICTLGRFAAHTLLNEISPISRLRGKWFDFNGIKLMPTYHPAYLLRNPGDKKLVWDDMKKIIKFLGQYET